MKPKPALRPENGAGCPLTEENLQVYQYKSVIMEHFEPREKPANIGKRFTIHFNCNIKLNLFGAF